MYPFRDLEEMFEFQPSSICDKFSIINDMINNPNPNPNQKPEDKRIIKPRKSSLKLQKISRNELAEQIEDLSKQLFEVKNTAAHLRAKVGFYELNEKLINEMQINNRDIFNNWLEWKKRAELAEALLEKQSKKF